MPVGAIRAFDVLADNPGDWAFHCHKSHHTMNAMGHDMRNLIGVLAQGSREGGRQARARRHGDGSDRHGDGQHGDAGARQHAADDDRHGPFGPIEMGGMFTVVKMREDLARDDYRDPGPYRHPARHRRLRGRCTRRRAGAPATANDSDTRSRRERINDHHANRGRPSSSLLRSLHLSIVQRLHRTQSHHRRESKKSR